MQKNVHENLSTAIYHKTDLSGQVNSNQVKLGQYLKVSIAVCSVFAPLPLT